MAPGLQPLYDIYIYTYLWVLSFVAQKQRTIQTYQEKDARMIQFFFRPVATNCHQEPQGSTMKIELELSQKP